MTDRAMMESMLNPTHSSLSLPGLSHGCPVKNKNTFAVVRCADAPLPTLPRKGGGKYLGRLLFSRLPPRGGGGAQRRRGLARSAERARQQSESQSCRNGRYARCNKALQQIVAS